MRTLAIIVIAAIVIIIVFTIVIVRSAINTPPNIDSSGNVPNTACTATKEYETLFSKLESYITSLARPIDIEVFPRPVYYINLDANSTRDKSLRKQFEYYDVKNVHRVQAIDGRGGIMPVHLDGKPISTTFTGTTSTEMGCLLSHIKAIANAYNDGCDTAIILEDDVYFMHARLWRHNAIRRIIAAAPCGWNMLNLFCLSSHPGMHMHTVKKCSEQFTHSDYAKYEPGVVNGMLTLAYVINRQGMINILNHVDYFGDVVRLRNDKSIYNVADSLLFDWVGDMYFVKPTTVFPHNDQRAGIVTSIQKADDILVMQRAALVVIKQYTS